MGYASAMAWVLFLDHMACTLVLIRTSQPLGPLPGGVPIADATTVDRAARSAATRRAARREARRQAVPR